MPAGNQFFVNQKGKRSEKNSNSVKPPRVNTLNPFLLNQVLTTLDYLPLEIGQINKLVISGFVVPVCRFFNDYNKHFYDLGFAKVQILSMLPSLMCDFPKDDDWPGLLRIIEQLKTYYTVDEIALMISHPGFLKTLLLLEIFYLKWLQKSGKASHVFTIVNRKQAHQLMSYIDELLDLEISADDIQRQLFCEKQYVACFEDLCSNCSFTPSQAWFVIKQGLDRVPVPTHGQIIQLLRLYEGTERYIQLQNHLLTFLELGYNEDLIFSIFTDTRWWTLHRHILDTKCNQADYQAHISRNEGLLNDDPYFAPSYSLVMQEDGWDFVEDPIPSIQPNL